MKAPVSAVLLDFLVFLLAIALQVSRSIAQEGAMVNLTIRLSKDGGTGAASSKLAAVVDLEPLTSSGPPACLDHLELDEMPQAAGVGALNANATVNILGRKCQRKLGSKVHFCVRCNFPIAIYGRLDPCEHIFCLICAKKDPICFLCEERIIGIQKLEVLGGIYICGAPGCLRSFLKKLEFESHIEGAHKALLQRSSERDEKAETQLQTQSYGVTPTVQGQPLPPPPQPQQPRQQKPQSSEEKPVQGYTKHNSSMASSFHREEKQLQLHQLKAGNHQQDRHAQKQQQHPQHHHASISQKKSQQNFYDNYQQHDHPQEHGHQQGQQEQHHHPSHQAKQSPEVQHPERPVQRPLHLQGIPSPPPFLSQPYPSSYQIQSDKSHFQQPPTPCYDSPKFGSFLDHRMPAHPGISDYEDKSRSRHGGNGGPEREGGPASNAQQEGFASIERQAPMPHYHTEYGARGPPFMGKGIDHYPHFQEVLHAHSPPAPKRGKYGLTPPTGEGPADNLSSWGSGMSKFGPGPPPGTGFVG